MRVFYSQAKHRVKHLLSAQIVPFGFEQTSDFSEKRKIIFINPLKSSFESIEGLFQRSQKQKNRGCNFAEL